MFLVSPEKHFPDAVHNRAQCPVCDGVFVLGNGVGYEGVVNTKGGQTYGTLVLCTLECLLIGVHIEGEA